MELDPKDYNVVKLLTKIKQSGSAYPAELLNPRRQMYIKRVAEIGLGIGIGTGLKTTIKGGEKTGAFSSVAGGLVEATLVVAIMAEAGVAAYIYRDKISALIKPTSIQPNVVEVASPTETRFSPKLPRPVVPLIEPSEASPTSPSSATPSLTAVPGAAAGNNNQNNQGLEASATPDPKGNNGNQYGLTPKPDRTKAPGGNNDNNNNKTNKDKGK